ncbi:hypothetical protein [Bacillus subtilis]|uniref:hypothetical protein n=1 Tax=Bacillus subtilis TaxID=1423 RepID=UPI001B9A25F9|nr:hypothetical protein [Bacillus subtilis]MEC1806953.1 hypothetical protein [Bacillus subtilis]WVM73150.1 hypothetical protein V0Q53_04615 [Bacillus subtilis]CAF1916261.1 hypothetical protein NRS6206_03814 [Bacillus subtilis]
MKRIENPKLNDVKILKKDVSSFAVELEKGDKVQIIGIGERGYDLKYVDSGEVVKECGWDLFE